NALVLVVEPAVEQEVLKQLEQVFGTEVVERVREVFGVLDVFHNRNSKIESRQRTSEFRIPNFDFRVSALPSSADGAAAPSAWVPPSAARWDGVRCGNP